MDKILISIIIPVYQVEDYISECIESILSQTYQAVEIILVDDGSTDDSSRICDSYAKLYPDIRVIHKANEGTAIARNAGMKIASGNYVMFLDSDDLLADSDILRHMVARITKTKADILTGNFYFYRDGHPGKLCLHHLQNGAYVQTPGFRFHSFYHSGHLSYVWGKLYRRDFLEKAEIIFQHVPFVEDKLFNLKCYLQGAAYDFTECPVIFYRQRTSAQTSSYHPDFIQIWLYLGKEYSKLQAQYHAPQEYEDILAFHYFFGSFLLVKQELENRKTKHPMKKSVEALKKYLSFPSVSHIYRELLSGKYIQTLPLHWKLIIRGSSFLLTCKQYFFFVFCLHFRYRK